MAITYKDINLLSQKASVAGTEKLPVSDTQYITPNQIAGLVGSNFVDKTSDETVGGDKTFTDNIGVVDADHIVYSGGGGGGGFTKGMATKQLFVAANSITFTGLIGEPKAFVVSLTWGGVVASGDSCVVSLVGDSTGCHGIYTTGSQHNYSASFTKSYSSGSLTITAPPGQTFYAALYSIVYYYGEGALTFHTSTIQPGSGVTAVTFTGTDLTETPAMYACMLESQVNIESYRRVALYTTSGFEEDEEVVLPIGLTFYTNNPAANTTSSFSVSYNNGLVINSGGMNAGGYFHNPGTYVLYYLMASDVSGGGGYSSLGDELDAIRTDIGDIQTLLEAI